MNLNHQLPKTVPVLRREVSKHLKQSQTQTCAFMLKLVNSKPSILKVSKSCAFITSTFGPHYKTFTPSDNVARLVVPVLHSQLTKAIKVHLSSDQPDILLY